jgi:hypothetical protein
LRTPNQTKMKRLFTDFNGLDSETRAVIDYWPLTTNDIRQLREGERVLLWDEQMEAEVVLKLVDGHWRATVDWKTLIDRETKEPLRGVSNSHLSEADKGSVRS